MYLSTTGLWIEKVKNCKMNESRGGKIWIPLKCLILAHILIIQK